MRLSLKICIFGIIFFTIPLLFIFQNFINSLKLASDKDNKVASTGPSLFLIFFNIVIASLIIFGFIYFIYKLWNINRDDSSTSSSSSSSSSGMPVLPTGVASPMSPLSPMTDASGSPVASPIFVPASHPVNLTNIVDLQKDIVTVTKGNTIYQLNRKDSLAVQNVVNEIRKYNGDPIITINS